MWRERVLRRLGPRVPELPPVDESERLATYPPPYPRGWYSLGDAEDFPRGRPRFVEALGQKLVVFRGENGAIGVLDAYCPHMGANLAGGRVRGECLECPFHRWTFDATGAVRRIPYATRIPETLRTRAWIAREHHGLVLVWSGDAAPDYEIDALEPELAYRGRHDGGVIRMHLCEFAENSADPRHFDPIHGDMFVPWTRFKVPGIRIHHEASWEADPERPHIAYFHDQAVLEVLGRVVPRSAGRATITFYGPGGVVAFRFQIPDLGRIVVFQTHLPVRPLAQRIRFRWFAERSVPRPLVSYVVGNWISQWREDISIWENKIFRPKPMLVPGDGPVHAMRRWFRQFY